MKNLMYKVNTAAAVIAAVAGGGLGRLYGASSGAATGAPATGRASGALAIAAVGGATGAGVGAADYPADVYVAPAPAAGDSYSAIVRAERCLQQTELQSRPGVDSQSLYERW